MARTIGFPDGDVSIILTRKRQFRLHRNVLVRASPTFAKLLDESYAAPLSAAAEEQGIVTRYRLVLIDNPVSEEEEEDEINFVFEPVQLDSNAQPLYHKPSGVDEGDQDTESDPLLDAYQSVLGAFYNSPMDLGAYEEGGITSLLAKAIFVVDVAQYLECIPLITAPVESAFLAIGQPFFVSVASNPAIWLRFAQRLRSRIIFKEALIHAAGKFNTRVMQTSWAELSDEQRELITEKAATLKRWVQEAERKISDFYPSPLQREKVSGLVDRDNIGRASYSNDILFWMALAAFRQFFTSCVLDKETHEAGDMGYRFMLAVSKGGDAYMTRHQMHSFHDRFPMSNKAMATVEFRVNEIKEQVKQHAELNLEQHPVGHYTCTVVSGQDFPWTRPARRVVAKRTTPFLEDDDD